MADFYNERYLSLKNTNKLLELIHCSAKVLAER